MRKGMMAIGECLSTVDGEEDLWGEREREGMICSTYLMRVEKRRNGEGERT